MVYYQQSLQWIQEEKERKLWNKRDCFYVATTRTKLLLYMSSYMGQMVI